MGLDQYAYAAASDTQSQEFWDNYDVNTESSSVQKPKDLAYWRKHPNLQGWMEQLWIAKGSPGADTQSPYQQESVMFNGVQLELTWEDIEQLERAVKEGRLPQTQGFFFGDPSDDRYREQDLGFCRAARTELFLGLKVFYNSSW